MHHALRVGLLDAPACDSHFCVSVGALKMSLLIIIIAGCNLDKLQMRA